MQATNTATINRPTKLNNGSKTHHITINSQTNEIIHDNTDELEDDEDSSLHEPLEVELEWGEDKNSNDNITIKNEILDYAEDGSKAVSKKVPLVVSANTNPGNVKAVQPPIPKGQPCNCPNCQKSVKGRASRHNCHIEGCGKEYAKTSHLRAHLGSHNTVLPYGCEWPGCEKRFYRTDQLSRYNFSWNCTGLKLLLLRELLPLQFRRKKISHFFF